MYGLKDADEPAYEVVAEIPMSGVGALGELGA